MDTPGFLLRSTSDSAAEPIPLVGALTLIGREEPQLLHFGEGLLAGIETRHARIISEANSLVLLDLSESGATYRNGEPVGQAPVTLKAGDLLRFGERLEFRLEVLAVSPATRLLTPQSTTVQLLLTPVSELGPRAPIAVSEFPFLISSSDGHFATYQAAFSEPMSFLSRRHAHIYQREDTLCLEDLGSTNGTRHNGEALKDRVVVLSDGDEVRFGHRDFTFTVGITVVEAGSPETERALPDGTVMISSAGSFLDVYCDAGADTGDGDVDPGRDDASPQDDLSKPGTGWAGALHFLRLRWHQWPYLRARQVGVFLVLPLLLVALAAFVASRDGRPQEIRELLAQDRSEPALQLAAAYAGEHAGEADAQRLLESTFEAAVLPDWIARLEAGDPVTATALLDQRLELAPTLSEDRSVGLLRWVGALYRFALDAGDRVPVSVVGDNRELKGLAAHWRLHSDHYTRLLNRLTDAYPALAPVHTRAMSTLRAIQGSGADQLEVVAELHTRVDELLKQSNFDAAQALVEQVTSTHPELRDLDTFRAELARLAATHAARTASDLSRFLDLTEALSFSATLFQPRARALARERSTALAVNERLSQARAQWQRGQLEQAIQTLDRNGQGNEQDDWQNQLITQQQRYQKLRKDFTALLARVGSDAYPDALIDFYVRLDDEEDTFMRQALADDFANQRERAEANARKLAAAGTERWRGYQETFQGISGGLRLESEVSEAYQRLATQLTDSQSLIQRAYRLFRLLSLELPEPLIQAEQQVEDEVLRQRSAIDALRYVLGDTLVQEKLDLLPMVEERS